MARRKEWFETFFDGLYGEVPFLFSLALAAITAFITITTFRMFVSPRVHFGRWTLKDDRTWARAGILFVALTVPWLAFTVHSGLVQWHMWRGGVHVEATAPASAAAWSQDPDALAAVQDEVHDAVAAARFHFDRAEALGLVSDVRIIRQRAWLALVDGRLPEAERLLREAVELTPTFDSSRNHLGRVLLLEGDLEGAITAFQDAVRLAEHRPEYREQLARALTQAGRDEEARAALASVAAEYPDRSSALLQLAALLHRTGQSRQAAGILVGLLERHPEDLVARAQLAGILVESGRGAEARAELQKILAAQPEHVEARFQVATLLYLGGDGAGGLAALEDAWGRATAAQRERFGRQMAGNPEVGRALLALGTGLLARGERGLALPALLALWEAWPDDPAVAFPYAQALLGAERYAETEAVAARTLEAAPGDRRLLHLQGLALFLLERPGEAADTLERAAALDPGDPDLGAHLAEALIAAGRRERARAVIDQGLAATPAHPGLLRLKRLLEGGSPPEKDQN